MSFPNTDLSFNTRIPATGKGARHLPSQNLSKGALQLKRKQENNCLPLDRETGNYTKQRFSHCSKNRTAEEAHP